MAGHRRGGDTKSEIQEVALSLFTERGYEATSLREIAECLGITKAALYYHFASKEDIVRSLLTAHLANLDELIGWAATQPAGPQLREEIIDRWSALAAGRGLRTMRFVLTNHRVVRDLRPEQEGVFERLLELFDSVTDPEASLEETLRTRVALLSINLTLVAAQGLDAPDEQVIDVARRIAQGLNPRPGPARAGV
ncbi:TetR/AcrR family transcriptional regulator [Streptomyces sp. NPDC092296]|uniref:TetR/AcrR family transcriptional regulator n=1 Tax=Streptomyces sp. NPDC092296 TaxID=3366012 RepID=UPI003812AD86